MLENDKDKMFAFWLVGIGGVGSKTIGKLMDFFGSEREIFNAKPDDIYKVPGIRKEIIQKIIDSRNYVKIQKRWENLCEKNIGFTYIGASDYPEKLKNIYDPPYNLFYKGELPDPSKPAVAVVGARNAAYEARCTAEKFGRELAKYGVQVISGLARGIDIKSQIGAMSVVTGKTFGVLGCGIDICYPKQHINEYMMMQTRGGIISEYAPGTFPAAGNFPRRNCIISGLSDGILVIQAGKKSGSLITAELGLEQGKDIFVVPGSINDDFYQGSKELIKNGAALVTNGRDILDALGIFYSEDVNFKNKKNNLLLETAEKIVYASLSLEPAHVSEVAEQTGMRIPVVMDKLISLELKGLVTTIGNNYYAIKI